MSTKNKHKLSKRSINDNQNIEPVLENNSSQLNVNYTPTASAKQSHEDFTQLTEEAIATTTEVYFALMNNFYSTMDLSTNKIISLLQESIECKNIDDFLTLKKNVIHSRVDLLHYFADNYTKNIQNYINNCCKLSTYQKT